MPENILQNIIKKKEIRIAELKKKKPLESIKQLMPDSMNYLDFKETIEENIKELSESSLTKGILNTCLLYTSPSPRDDVISRMPSSA